ncbi:hypothetical protein Nepgr_003805 [Nepenthes gracilis]|uniref:Uncharacterized protein n=1 Tax=Nepenthes gracilis TaxID=150966 RepID=A0AAD3XEG9_NEPGR|nr:hypothetical protein Nepgr_003805 [Nepenthes gracilis]
MKSLEEPVCELMAATRTIAVEPILGLDSPAAAPEVAGGDPTAATPEATREEPTAAAPETTREEPAAAMGEDDELVERVLDEVAANLALEGAPGPPPPGLGLEARPERPTRRLCESRKLISAFSWELAQCDQTIADREAKIAWLDARLAASGGEHREQTAALEAVLAGIETEIASLRAENARLKEEEDRSKASMKRLADRISTLENELGLRICPHELEGMLHARMFEGVQVCRRLVKLIDPDFPVQYLHLGNRGVQHKDDLVAEEPQDSQRRPLPP